MSSVKTRQKRHKLSKQVLGWTAPDFSEIVETNENYQQLLGQALSYANYVFDKKQLGKYARDYANDSWNISLDNVPDYSLISSGAVCWVLANGGWISDTSLEELKSKFEELAEKSSEKEYTPKKKTIKQFHTEEVLKEIEGIIDDVWMKVEKVQQPADVFKKFSQFDVKKVKDFYSEQSAALLDAENAEYFDRLTSEEKKRFEIVFRIILNDLEEFVGLEKDTKRTSTKKARKPRKINPSKMVKRLKYLKKDEETGYSSIFPEQIIGATILWLYNTKTRKLGRYISETGFTIKGSTLLGWSEEQSSSKKLRKPKETLQELMACGKVEQRRFLDGIKSKNSPLNGRINQYTVLLKVW